MSQSRRRTQEEMEELFDGSLAKYRKEKGFIDQHVHTMPSVCGPSFCLRGPDNLFDYHYAYGEHMSETWMSDSEAKAYWAMEQHQRVDLIARHLFARDVLPVSEAALGILSTAEALGLPTASGNSTTVLSEWREMYADMGDEAYADHVFTLSGVTHVISTQSVFNKDECLIYLDDANIEQWDDRYMCGLRFDEYVYKPEVLEELCTLAGFPEAAQAIGQEKTQTQARKLLRFWVERLPNVKYVALSMPGSTDFSASNSRLMLTLEKIIIPAAKELGLPIYLMPFVRRQINPAYRNAGDVVERGDVNGLIDFIGKHREALFCVTPLHEGDNYDFAFATRALGNLRVWGHWWGNLNDVLVEEQLRLRLQMNGHAHFGFNSDARIDDQLIYKWIHYFRILKKVVVERCMQIQQSGWPITEKDMMGSIDLLQNPEGLFALAGKHSTAG